MTQQPTPIRIFIAYSREDELMLNQLRVFLRPLERRKDITMWYDGKIMPGETWEKSIKDNLYAADLILLLMSADSIDSDYFWDKERADALARHKDGECRVVPIILKPCGWKYTELAKLQALPTNGEPITAKSWATHDEAYHSVLEGLFELVTSLQEKEAAAKRQAEEQAEKEQQEREQAANHLQSAQKYESQQKYPEAIAQIQAAIKLKPELQNEYSNKLQELAEKVAAAKRQAEEQAKKERQAREQAEKVAAAKRQAEKEQQEREQVANHLQSAQKYESQQKYPEAIAQLQAAIKLKPELQNEHSNKLQELANKATAKRQAEEEAQKVAAAKRQAEKEQQECEQAEKLKKLPQPIQKLLADMVLVEGGTFEMGSNEGDDEKPIHQVSLDSYHIGKYTIIQTQWQAVMGNNPSRFKGDTLPVDTVSWDDTQVFIEKLNAMLQKTGLPTRFALPTESQWEYAARGGKHSKGYQYAGSNNIDEVAWYGDNSGSKTQPVGQKNANELGLYDMHGNVWEWCNDWYGENYYKNSPANNPTGPTTGTLRVLRGGSWGINAQFCRVAFRYSYAPGDRYADYGFRLVLVP